MEIIAGEGKPQNSPLNLEVHHPRWCHGNTCLTQLYDGRDMYIIYCIKNNYMFRHFSLAIFRLINKKT